MSLGAIPAGRLYRSSSPIDPGQGGRRLVADALLKETGVARVVNTSDCRLRFRAFEGFDATHYAKLDQVALNMGRDYSSTAFLEDLRNALDYMGEFEGPYLIHGTHGVERTGYVCMVLEALMGATRAEVLADYLRSYADYYQVSPGTPAWQALETKAEGDLTLFAGSADGPGLARATEDYLLRQVGLTPKQLEALKTNLSRP